jgi:DNA-binding transcriptional ArsR family regulator
MIARRPAVDLDHAFGALAHPVRRRILEATIRKGRGVTELTEEVDISLAAVSKHVKVPERAGLVSREIVGRDHVIRARMEELRAARDWIERQTAFWERAMARLKADLETPSGAPRVEVTTTIRAPRERVFDAWLTSTRARSSRS